MLLNALYPSNDLDAPDSPEHSVRLLLCALAHCYLMMMMVMMNYIIYIEQQGINHENTPQGHFIITEMNVNTSAFSLVS